ncbi:energy transducer TonB [Seonamhaeicola sp. ML3]|uniref:energy transducer TonB n=1 Tax=Seonamhaeicola sp. ML3 TaxID=2937786 RepID=UPI00200D4E60|nr:energy transducer TonB [Seonamhaeicola sp. ML3]
MKYFSIKIPEPCHEDWNTMTPKEKGRYCDACSKTVIDFTKMNTNEIQDFVNLNMGKRICGHFKPTQLDSINIRVPSEVLQRQHSFHKLFLLALLITMGTSLMNCTNKRGEHQKIDSVEVIDSLSKETVDVLGGLPIIEQMDSIPEQRPKSKKADDIEEIPIDGEIAIPIVGDIDYSEPNTDSLINKMVVPTWCPEAEHEIKGDVIMGFVAVENPPEFKGTAVDFSIKEKRDYFQKRMTEFVSENFKTDVCSGLKGKQKIVVRFEIDNTGRISKIQVRAPHPALEKEAKRVFGLLPKFIPAKQRGKPIKIAYTLPIVFNVEE